MSKESSTLFSISIVRYLEENYPQSNIQAFVDEINEVTPYYVENLDTGRIELVALKHLTDENYWLSHTFLVDFTSVVRNHIPENNLFYNAGDAIYHTRSFLKTAVGMPFLGPQKMVTLLQQENDKYNRTKDIILLTSEKGHIVFRAVFFEGLVTVPFGMEWGAGLLRSYIRLSGATNVKVSHKWIDKGPQEPGEKRRAICEFDVRFKDPGLFNRLFRAFIFHIPIVKKAMEHANKIQAEHKERILTQHKIIEEKTGELKRANEQLVELDRLKTEFYTNITHELRTPLTLIQSQIDAVLEGHFGQTLDKSSDVFESAKRNADLLRRLIDNLLDFSKIESGKMKASFSDVHLPSFLSHIHSNFESAMEHNNLDFQFIDKTNNLYASLDKDLFEKGLYNLLSNAMKFTPTNGCIKLMLMEGENEIIISVKDTGIGIAKENHKIVFDRFHQVDSSSTRKYEGTGIGLALTKKVVEIHQGVISIESELGKGATFTIKLPRLKVENTNSVPNENFIKRIKIDTQQSGEVNFESGNAGLKMVESVKKFSVLVVEDNDDLRSFIKKLLSVKYSVTTAKNGLKALSRLKEADVDLVISDIMMPEMDGLELLEKIRSDNQFSWIPVIMLTARADFPMKMEGFSHGANDYIVKPFKPDELYARIKSQLSLVKLRREYKAALENKNKKTLTDDTIIAIEKVQRHIKLNYQENISRDNLASIIEMSPDHLSRMFKKHVGKTIKDFTNELRIDSCLIDLQRNEKKIVDIAFDAGFEHISSFNRVFKKIKGMTPSEYKKKITA